MGSVSVFAVGANSLTNLSEASGTYWYISLVGCGKMDLSKAVFRGDGPVCINIITLFGLNHIRVPRGTRVEFAGVQVIGGNRSKGFPAETEVKNHLRVRLFCVAGGTNVSIEEAP